LRFGAAEMAGGPAWSASMTAAAAAAHAAAVGVGTVDGLAAPKVIKKKTRGIKVGC
jgi:hypothetical protein